MWELAECALDQSIEDEMADNEAARQKEAAEREEQELKWELERQECEQQHIEEERHLAKIEAECEHQLKVECDRQDGAMMQLRICMEQEQHERLEYKEDIPNANEARKALNLEFNKTSVSLPAVQ